MISDKKYLVKANKPARAQQMDGQLHTYDTQLAPAKIRFKTNCDRFSSEYDLPTTWVRTLNLSIDFIIGLNFLLHQNGGILISRDYLQIHKELLFTPVENHTQTECDIRHSIRVR